MTRKTTLVLTDGERVTGTPNYVTVKHVELRLADGSMRWIERAQIGAR